MYRSPALGAAMPATQATTVGTVGCDDRRHFMHFGSHFKKNAGGWSASTDGESPGVQGA